MYDNVIKRRYDSQFSEVIHTGVDDEAKINENENILNFKYHKVGIEFRKINNTNRLNILVLSTSLVQVLVRGLVVGENTKTSIEEVLSSRRVPHVVAKSV